METEFGKGNPEFELVKIRLKIDLLSHSARSVYIYIYIYIYIYCQLQTDCFFVSQLFRVARYEIRSKPGSKPTQLFVRLMTYPMVKPATQRQFGN